MKKYLLIVFFLIAIIGYSQEQPVEILYSKIDNGYVIKAKNNSDERQEVKLTMEIVNLNGYKEPITKLVPAKTTLDMVTLTFPTVGNGKYDFSYTFNYISKPTEGEIALKDKILKEKLIKKTVKRAGDLKKGIIVFSIDGCSRCHYTTRYLIDNNIDFKILNVTENKDLNDLMWTLLREDNPLISGKTILMPVIIVDGKISHTMDDLKGFVSNLKDN